MNVFQNVECSALFQISRSHIPESDFIVSGPILFPSSELESAYQGRPMQNTDVGMIKCMPCIFFFFFFFYKITFF